jgi:dihydroneopterin aldolase
VALRDVALEVRIGAHAAEREAPQPVLVDVELYRHHGPFGEGRLADCLNYDRVFRHLVDEWPRRPHTDLLERLAEDLVASASRTGGWRRAASSSASRRSTRAAPCRPSRCTAAASAEAATGGRLRSCEVSRNCNKDRDRIGGNKLLVSRRRDVISSPDDDRGGITTPGAVRPSFGVGPQRENITTREPVVRPVVVVMSGGESDEVDA